MRPLLIALLFFISFCGFGQQAENLKAALEFADALKKLDQPRFTYKAFIIYDLYEDYRAIIPPEKQQDYDLPDKSADLETCVRRVKTQRGYSNSQRFVVEVLIRDGKPTGYCPDYTEIIPSSGGNSLAGSGVRFKTNEDLLLAYSLMDRVQQQSFKGLISEDLQSELEKFEEEEFFDNYTVLVSQNQIEIRETVFNDVSDEQVLENLEVDNLLNSSAVQSLNDQLLNPDVRNTLELYLNEREALDQRFENIQNKPLGLSEKDLRRLQKATDKLEKAAQKLEGIQ